MLKKNKIAKPPRIKKDVAPLLELQRTSLSHIDEALAAAEATTDVAGKIVKLLDVQRAIQQGRLQSHYKQEDIIHSRTEKKYYITGFGGGYGTLAAIAVPICILAPPAFIPLMALSVFGAVPSIVSLKTGRTEKKKRKQLAEQNPGFAEFATTLVEREERVAEMLDDTIKNCDFEKTWLSPAFGRALGECIPLRERFAQAVIDGARQANEEEAKARQDMTKPVKPRPYNRLGITR